MSAIDRLIKTPQAFEFLQATRLLWHHKQSNPISRLDLKDSGYRYPYVRYKSSLSLAFPVAEIESLHAVHYEPKYSLSTKTDKSDSISIDQEKDQDSNSYTVLGFEICPAMIGLTGPLGTLPYVYTQNLSGRAIHFRDRAAPAFLDIFNHRLTELYVDASWFYSLPLQYERSKNKDTYINCLRALASQPLTELTELDAMVAYAGLLRPSRLTAEQIAQVVGAYFQVEVQVDQFVPEWFDLEFNQQSSIGVGNAELGVDTFLGNRVLQLDTKIRINFLKLNKDTYLDLLPQGKITQVVIQFLRQWCGTNMAVEIQLELDKSYIKPLSLNEESFGALGRGGFLLSQPSKENSKDTSYHLPFEVISNTAN